MAETTCACRPTSTHAWQSVLEQYGRPQPGDQGRRRECRYDVFATAKVSAFTRGEGGTPASVECNVTDISAHGMALRCPAPMPTGTRLSIAVTLVGQTFHLAGTVANCIPVVGAQRIGVGLSFE